MLALVFVGLLNQSIYAFSTSYFMQYLVSAIQKEEDFLTIAMFVVGMFVLFVIADFFAWCIYQYYQDITWTKFNREFNKSLFKKAGNCELGCFEDPKFYNKYTMALDNTSNRLMNVCSSAIGSLASLYRVIFLIIAIFSINKGVILFLIFPIIGEFVFGARLNKIEQKKYKENTKNSRLIDYVKRVLHLQQFSKEMRLTNVYDLIQSRHKKAVKDTNDITDKFSFKIGLTFWTKNFFIFTLIFEGVLLYCSFFALVDRSISLAQLTVMTSVMGSLTWGVIDFFEDLMNIHSESLHIQNARDFLKYEPKIPEDSDGEDAPDAIESIEFKNVSFGYKEDRQNIKNISFKINGSESVAFVGQNGAGKTTLIKLLFRLYDADEGEILLNGRNIKEFNLLQYRKLFAAAFQDYKVVAMSVKDNIIMGNDVKDPEKTVYDVLKKVGLWDKINSLENGIDTIMTKEFDDNGAVLSGGQYQKLAVARAIAHNCPSFVFDEPSSALDPIAEYELFKTIMEESADKTMIFISHRLSSVKNADMVFMLENGELIESGTHKELMKINGKYAEMYSYQARNYLAKEETV